MNLIFKIAWRNILRHRGKSLVIGLILLIGAFLLTLGNGVLTGMDRGIEANVINSLTGHLIIVSQKQKSDNVFFDLYGKAIAPINNFPQIREVLKKDDAIVNFLPVGKNMALSLHEESDAVGAWLLGVDFPAYQRMFPDSLIVVEGRLLKGGERGVLMPTHARKELYDYTNIWLLPEGGEVVEANLTPEARQAREAMILKSTEVFLGSNEDNSTTDVRVGIKGIIKYRALNDFWGNFAILDIESYRECLGYFSAADNSAAIPQETQKLLSMDSADLDSAFIVDDIVSPDRKERVADVDFKRRQATLAPPAELENGTYNMVFVKLKDGRRLDAQAAVLDQRLKEAKLGVRVLTWKKASGLVGSLAVLIKGFLFGFVAFLFLVAIIIIMNTLSMTALERVTEIGMMRAVGAQKSFISAMFMGETAILSGIFGGFGILLGVLTIMILPHLNITTDNDMLQLLYGGHALTPVLTGGDFLLTVMQLVGVTVLSSIFPISIAIKITPLDAVSRE